MSNKEKREEHRSMINNIEEQVQEEDEIELIIRNEINKLTKYVFDELKKMSLLFDNLINSKSFIRKSDIDALKKEISEFEKVMIGNLNYDETRKNILREAIEDIYNKLEGAEELLNKQQSLLLKEKEELTQRLSELKKKNDERVRTYDGEIAHLTVILSNLKKELEKIDIESLKEELTELDYRRNDLYSILERELNFNNEQIELKNKTYSELKGQSLLKLQMLESQKVIEIDELLQKNISLKKELESLKYSIENEISRGNNIRLNRENEIKLLKEEIEKVKSENSESSSLLATKEQLTNEIKELEEKIKFNRLDLFQKLKAKKEEIEKLKKMIAEKEKIAESEIKEKKNELINENLKLEKSVNHLKEHLGKLTESSKEMENRYNETIRKLKEKLEIMKTETMKQVTKRKNIEKTIEDKLLERILSLKATLKEQLLDMQKRIQQKDNKIQELKSILISENSKLADNHTEDTSQQLPQDEVSEQQQFFYILNKSITNIEQEIGEYRNSIEKLIENEKNIEKAITETEEKLNLVSRKFD